MAPSHYLKKAHGAAANGKEVQGGAENYIFITYIIDIDAIVVEDVVLIPAPAVRMRVAARETFTASIVVR
jgi:hypothetical protein